MITLVSLALLYLLFSIATASPASPCRPVGIVKPPRPSNIIATVLGDVPGLAIDGVIRFTLPYAQPPIGPLRFANPQKMTQLNGYNVTKTPPSCYQGQGSLLGGNSVSEDCLYSTYYIPSSAHARNNLPILVWVHGGSGIVGTSTAAGLNGAPFVLSENVIIVIIQCRLGLFGWLQTEDMLDEINGGGSASSTVAGNQALRDIVMALQQVNDMAPLIGGSTSGIALLGQSSGAMMIRALLSTPSAQNLFTHAVLASDTADYGMANITDNNAMGDYAMSQLNCSLCDLICARRASADDVLSASLAAYSQVPFKHTGIPSGTPYRPMIGHYIPKSIEKGAKVNKSIIFTSVSNEAGPITSFSFNQSPPGATNLDPRYSNSEISMDVALETAFNAGRGEILANSSVYPVSQLTDALRLKFEKVVTDGLWRCAMQNTGQILAATGAKVWLAQWNVGSTYPSNVDADICTEDGHVCHEDDIYVIFGTSPNSPSTIQQLTKEWQGRLSTFVRTGKPNLTGYPSWHSIQSASQLNLLSLGEPTYPASTTCQDLWATIVKYDWQLYET